MSTLLPNASRRISLPYGISITVYASGAASLAGNLALEFLDGSDPSNDEPAHVAADAIESVLLALAAAGVDLETAACKEAIETAVEAVAARL